VQGKRHKRAVIIAERTPNLKVVSVAKKVVIGKCDTCNIEFDQKAQMEAHMKGKRHLKELSKVERAKRMWNQQQTASMMVRVFRAQHNIILVSDDLCEF